ncbi:MAG: 30S ribosomal protein S13 [Candidatus Bilamarchaeaceae archaeon]
MAVGKTPPKKKAELKKKEEKQEEKKESGRRGIVRIAGKDMKGNLTLKNGLLKIKGIGHTMAAAAANIISQQMNIPINMTVGELTDEQIEKIDSILYNLDKYGIPDCIKNRNKDYTTGENKHLIMNDLIFATTQDIEREKKIYSWRGYRHFYGQKVRGQRTRNTGRKGMAVGVMRKSVIAAQGGAKPAEKGGAAGPAKASAPAKAAAPAAEKKK